MALASHTLKATGIVCGMFAFVAIAVAGVNGNALAFVVGCTLLFGLAFHWFVSTLSIQNLEISIRPKATRARAFDPFPFEAELRNRSRWLPLFHPKFKATESGRSRSHTIVVPQTLSPRERLSFQFYPIFSKRGPQRLTVVEAYIHYPFGFTRARRTLRVESESIIVWPQTTDVPHTIFQRLERERRAASQRQLNARNDAYDPNRFREYAPGDSKRRINWKLSAKTDTLIVRDDSAGALPQMTWVLNPHPSNWRRPVDFEKALRLMSSALESSFAWRSLAGMRLGDQTLAIRSLADLENALDLLSAAQMDDTISADPPYLERGDFLIRCDRNGLQILDWKLKGVF